MSRVVIKFDRLPEIQGKYRSAAGMAVRRAALAIEKQTKANIVANDQVDTGAMLNSVQAEKVKEFNWLVSVGVEYAQYQEYGTYKMAPRPFFTPAIEQVTPDYIADMEALIAKSSGS